MLDPGGQGRCRFIWLLACLPILLLLFLYETQVLQVLLHAVPIFIIISPRLLQFTPLPLLRLWLDLEYIISYSWKITYPVDAMGRPNPHHTLHPQWERGSSSFSDPPSSPSATKQDCIRHAISRPRVCFVSYCCLVCWACLCALAGLLCLRIDT